MLYNYDWARLVRLLAAKMGGNLGNNEKANNSKAEGVYSPLEYRSPERLHT